MKRFLSSATIVLALAVQNGIGLFQTFVPRLCARASRVPTKTGHLSTTARIAATGEPGYRGIFGKPKGLPLGSRRALRNKPSTSLASLSTSRVSIKVADFSLGQCL